MNAVLSLWWRLVATLGAVERVVGALLLAGIVVTITLQVVTRYVWGRPLVWVEELATYSFIWAVFLGAALGLKELRHIRIETVLGRLPPRAAALLRAGLYALIGLCCAVLGSHALDIMQVEGRSETISLPVNIPRSFVYSVPLSVGLASMLFTAAYFVSAYLAAALTGRPVDAVTAWQEREQALRAEEEAEVRVAEASLT
jgi:TRAP-type transport system small permease protein